MRNTILIVLATMILVALLAPSCNNSTAEVKTKAPKPDSAAMVQRGKYLVNFIGCDDCHSPKRMGGREPEIIPELRFSGFPASGKLPPVNVAEIEKGWALMAPDLTAAVGPWGISYAANISSDATGIGGWKEEQFIKAIRHGKSKGLDGTRPLLPPMPWFVYKNMTDKDLKSIFAFLKTTRPVSNVVPSPKPLAQLK